MFQNVVMTTPANGIRPPDFPDMKSLFRETIELLGADVFEQIIGNTAGQSCCAMQVSNSLNLVSTFYRTMHVVLTRYCYRKSSVRPSVTLMYRGHIGWTSSKLITRVISLGPSLLGANIGNLVQGEHP